jgi:hypothetical protein
LTRVELTETLAGLKKKNGINGQQQQTISA